MGSCLCNLPPKMPCFASWNDVESLILNGWKHVISPYIAKFWFLKSPVSRDSQQVSQAQMSVEATKEELRQVVKGDFLWDFTSKTGQNWCFVQLVWPWGLGLLALFFFHIRESCFLRDFGMEKLNFTTRDGISRLKTWKLDQPKSGWNKKNMSFDNGQQRLTYIGKTVGNGYGGCENFLLRIDLLLEGAYSTDPAVPSQEVFRDISEIILRYFLREYVTLI